MVIKHNNEVNNHYYQENKLIAVPSLTKVVKKVAECRQRRLLKAYKEKEAIFYKCQDSQLYQN